MRKWRSRDRCQSSPTDALFSAAITMPRGCHVSRDGWFPGVTRMRKKNWATTTSRHLCWAYLSNLDFAWDNFIFIDPEFSIWEQALHAVGQENVLPQLTPSWGGEAGRRIYSMERTRTGTFEVAANPCNHGNFWEGSLETMGRPLSKYSGVSCQISPLQLAPHMWPCLHCTGCHTTAMGPCARTWQPSLRVFSLEMGSVTKHS